MDDKTHIFFSSQFIIWHTRIAIAVPRETTSQREVVGLRSSGWVEITYNKAKKIPLPEQLLILDPEWRIFGLYNWLSPLAAAALRRIKKFEICNDFPGGVVVHFLKRYFRHTNGNGKTYIIGLQGDTEEYIINRIQRGGWREIGIARILTIDDIYRPNGKNRMLARATMENELPLKVRAAIRGVSYDICTPESVKERGVVVDKKNIRFYQDQKPNARDAKG